MARFGHSPRWKKTWPVALALAFVLYTILTWNHFGLDAPSRAGTTAPSGQALAAPVPDGGGQAVLGRPVAGRRIQLPLAKTLPIPSAQERQAQQAAQAQLAQLKVPVGPVHHMTAAEAADLRRTAGPPLPLPRTASQGVPAGRFQFRRRAEPVRQQRGVLRLVLDRLLPHAQRGQRRPGPLDDGQLFRCSVDQ